MSNEKQVFPGKMLTKEENAIMEINQNLPLMLEYQIYVAKLCRAKYLALIAEGFTKEEALILCK